MARLCDRMKSIFESNPDNYDEKGNLKHIGGSLCAIGIDSLIGKTIIEYDTRDENSNIFVFKCDDGSVYLFTHVQDCCEEVQLDDICGNMDDLLNSPLTMAEEVTDINESGEGMDYISYTWTFYKFATAKGYVTLRWYGESNGYYSESVELFYLGKEN